MDSLPRRVAARSPTVIVLAPTELYLSAARSRLGSRISDERRALENRRACAVSPSCSTGPHPTALAPPHYLSLSRPRCCLLSRVLVCCVGDGDNRVSPSRSRFTQLAPALPWSPATPAYSTPDTRPCMCKQLFLQLFPSLFCFFFFFPFILVRFGFYF